MSKCCRGFTLIELLVVLGILIILSALIFPAVQRMKRTAAAAECLTNMKSLGGLFQMYSQDHEGEILPRYIGGEGYWYRSDSPLLSYASSDKVLQKLSVCPLNRTGSAGAPPVSNDAGYPYVANHYLMPGYGGAPVKRLSVEQQATRILLADSHAGDNWQSGFLPGSFQSAIDFKHGGKSNITFLDGHVETLAESDITPNMLLIP